MMTTIAILFLIASVLTSLFMGLFYLFRDPARYVGIEAGKGAEIESGRDTGGIGAGKSSADAAVKDPARESTKTVKMLTFRVIFSFAVFFAVMLSFVMQWFSW